MITDSFYAQYLKERYDAETLVGEFGFVAFKIKEKECFICELFIAPEARKSGQCRKLLAELESIAGARGCDIMTGNVFLDDKNGNAVLVAVLNIGFKAKAVNGQVILLAKEIGGNK